MMHDPNWIAAETQGRTCQLHGEYISTRMDRRNSKAPKFLREFWTNCPPCNSTWTMESELVASKMSATGCSHTDEAKREHRAAAGVPPRFLNNTLDDWQHPMEKQRGIHSWLKDYCQRIRTVKDTGQSIILSGQSGTGKTHAAVGIIAAVLDRGISAHYTTVMNMLSRIRDTFSDRSEVREKQIIDELSTVPFLVIDEVGKKISSEHDSAQLFRVIDNRYGNLKPTILVTNLNLTELKKYLGDPVIDRLRENGGKMMTLDWATHRGRKKK